MIRPLKEDVFQITQPASTQFSNLYALTEKNWGRTFFRQRQIDCQIGVISKTLKQ